MSYYLTREKATERLAHAERVLRIAAVFVPGWVGIEYWRIQAEAMRHRLSENRGRVRREK